MALQITPEQSHLFSPPQQPSRTHAEEDVVRFEEGLGSNPFGTPSIIAAPNQNVEWDYEDL